MMSQVKKSFENLVIKKKKTALWSKYATKFGKATECRGRESFENHRVES